MFPIHIPDVKPWWTRIRPTVHYLMETEAHVYALAVAASVMLAFYPFLTVMISLCENVLHWHAAGAAMGLAIDDFFAGAPGDLIARNLHAHKLSFTSMFLLLFTANGVFEPMEVALNRAWGVTENRSYMKNQLVSLGLIMACGGLALISVMLTAAGGMMISPLNGMLGSFTSWLQLLFFKLAAVPVSMLALFLVYWLLPNRKIEPVRVARVAIVVGLVLEALKYFNLIIATPLGLKMAREYGPFKNSVTILLYSFVSALIVLAGAHWTANHEAADPLSPVAEVEAPLALEGPR